MKSVTRKRAAAAALSVVLLSTGWLGISGLPLVVALVPLLYISASYGSSSRDFWHMTGWGALTFILWNIATIWWVWIASPAGPLVAIPVSTWWNLLPLMLYHYISKRASRALSYVALVSGWICTEYIYNMAPAMSFPWLTLGNGFSSDAWAVQWYEWTGVFGGSLWVLASNICIFEALLHRSGLKIAVATAVAVVPLALSVALYHLNDPYRHESGTATVSVVQPNIACYEKFSSNSSYQHNLLAELLRKTPSNAEFVLMPETSLATTVDEKEPLQNPVVQMLRTRLHRTHPQTMIVAGSQTSYVYDDQAPSQTARYAYGTWYDVFNTALGITRDSTVQMHHKGRMVIGVETVPKWVRHLKIASIDLGGMVGQLGLDSVQRVFTHRGTTVAPAICYEALYGDFMAGFVRQGAEALFVVSNDGWWGDTSGYKRLFGYCRLRAIETRRWVARSANTGISGFIDSRGRDVQRLGWDKMGLLTQKLPLRNEQTLYVRYGDYIGRVAVYVWLLSLVYFVAYRIKRRQHLAD